MPPHWAFLLAIVVDIIFSLQLALHLFNFTQLFLVLLISIPIILKFAGYKL